MRRTGCLVAAGVVLRRHKKQARFRFHGQLLRCASASLQDADDCGISRDDANSNRGNYRNAENQRHEKRNHGPPCLNQKIEIQKTQSEMAILRCRRLKFRLCSFLQSNCVKASR